ncbi:MAG: DoxX family membrane protein [Chloroflexi bacterium]|jgi:uncharacterized membrane protein YphA (DoxX/SURF4 family)|nr:DoxX family membrane protein [Chloroflexota bacterium]
MARVDKQRISSLISNSYLNLTLRLLLGVTFIVSAVSKLPDHTKFVEIVKDQDLLPDVLVTVFGNALPWIELVVGVYLLFGILRRPSALVTLLMAISFMIANVNSLINDKDKCGSCFGDTVTLTVAQSITIDIFIFIAALVLLLTPKVNQLLTLEKLIGMRK